MAKINLNSPLTMEEAFESFLFSKSAQGVTDKTLKSYRSHFKCISKYLDICLSRFEADRRFLHSHLLCVGILLCASGGVGFYQRAGLNISLFPVFHDPCFDNSFVCSLLFQAFLRPASLTDNL